MATMSLGSNVMSLNDHRPRKMFESKEAIIYDDFLPEDIYRRVQHFTLKTDYEHINTKGKISRAWHIHDGFPLRSSLNLFYAATEATRRRQSPVSRTKTGLELFNAQLLAATQPAADQSAGNRMYPTETELDLFTEHLLTVQPCVEHLVGKKGAGGWEQLSVTGWLYPPGTGLSMHCDGGRYTGAFVYFLSPTWRSYWGGMLLLADEEANRAIRAYSNTQDAQEFHELKWLNANHAEELLMEHGFAKCIFPKRNRLVFIYPDAYHMVTRVNEAAGDNVRMSLAGFFHKEETR
jgi:Rps23 Pro-64 3,4-dihydroxylase Tpa1-like proline 4-hydroxylase